MSTPLRSDTYQKTLDCVHCGLCLPACPTYRETGRETSSPRGRIYLVRGVAEGKIPLGDVVRDEMYLCLGCRACETACPSGVRFGSLLEETREAVEQAGLRRGWRKWAERLALRQVIPRRRLLHALVSLLSWVQRLGLDRLLRLWPGQARELRALLPSVPPASQRRPLPPMIPAQGTRRGRVGLFVGCVMPEFFGATNAATARLLARNGFDVVVAEGQGCCGALHAHGGDADFARQLMRGNLAAFEAAQVDAVIVNSAGCGAALREADVWLPGKADAFAACVRDVAEFLDEQGLRPPSERLEQRVCYDDPCHLVHGQGVQAAPRRLLAQIPGIELVEHEDPTACCGAAGIYNLTHRDMSQAVLARKMRAIAAVNPDVIATGNPGCLMQLASGAKQLGLRARIVHPVELLDEAYGSS